MPWPCASEAALAPPGLHGRGCCSARARACLPPRCRSAAAQLPPALLLLAPPRRRWGRASWKPWLLSLGVDLLSMQLGAAAARVSQARLQGLGCRSPRGPPHKLPVCAVAVA